MLYDLNSDGSISNGRVFHRDDELVADGMTLDTEGNLDISRCIMAAEMPPRGKIVVLSPAGQVLAKITPPEGSRPGNLGFGRGSDAASLYITTLFQWRLYRIKTVRRGHYFE